MTREEAIEVIKDIYNYTKWDTYTANEARTMAIKALEQEPILNKVMAEIEKQEKWLASAGYNAYNIDIAFNSIKSVLTETQRKVHKT